ncbi:MAG: TetR family transcriptional regulator [Selenomonadaceae bacterium]|nr:TetR family transcriptional regulator [Selenomonadaceae bacterium]
MITRMTTKEVIAESLKELSASKPIGKITIKDIVQNCGLTSKTFYNHFQDKYNLINAPPHTRDFSRELGGAI